ncbi:glycosyltransferase [Desulfoplanes formicivorans]|nr:glycosyltransferase [Desulfoplanes formicivorans]
MKWTYIRDQLLISGPSMLRYAYYRTVASIKKNASPKFSIVVPCYNNPQFLKNTVHSIAAQTLPPTSVVFVNDGSFSNTAEVITHSSSFLKKNNIKTITVNQKNKGVAAARNTGINEAEGEWIIPLDYDDTIAPRYIERCSDIIRTRPNVQFIYPHSLKTNTKDTYWIPRSGLFHSILERCLYPAFSAFNKNLWLTVGGYDVSHPLGMDDWDFFIKIVMSQAQCCRLPFFMGTWRGHDMNETHTARRNWKCGRAMIVTLSYKWRNRDETIAALEAITDMSGEVIKRLQQKVHLFPTHPYPYMWLALVYKKQKKLDQAIQFARKAKALDPSNWLMAHVAKMIA